MEQIDQTLQRDLVFTLSNETLRDMAIRSYMRPPDRLLISLLHNPLVRRMLVAEPYRSRMGVLTREPGGRVVTLPPTGRAERYVVSPLRWRRTDPVPQVLLRATFRRFDAVLARAAARARCEKPVVITTQPLLAGFADLSWASSVVYFARDDWATHPALTPWHDAIRDAYAEIRYRRRPVVAVSEPLLDRIQPTGGGLVVHNGVDPDEWLRPAAPPDWVQQLPRPLCVYAGTVDTRLDVDMVRQLASAATIVLAGPVYDEAHIAPLRSLPSVKIPGHLRRPEITGLVAAADVCLLPHRKTPLTEAMDPIKLYEYLAAGRPVLSTELTPVLGLDPRIRLLGAGEDPVTALREVMEWPALDEADRHKYIGNNSWAARHVPFLEFALGIPAGAQNSGAELQSVR